MAVDLSIQVFSYELFNTLFVDHGLLNRDPLPKAIYDTIYCGYKGETHCNNDIIHAVYCRQAIFHDVYRLQLEYTNMDYCDGPSDFLAYMCSTFSSREFKDLKVFEHVFATCAFVIEMCLNCFYKANNSFCGDAYLCWAMYFDAELRKDFYEQGGWNVLKSVARSYLPPFLVIKNCVNYQTMYDHRSLIHTVPLRKLSTCMENLYNFQTFSDAGDNLTRAKTWVDFHLNNNRNHPKKSVRSKFDIETIGGLEHFLRCFKFLCDPLGEMVLAFDASNQDKNTSTTFPTNKDFAKNNIKMFDCNINSVQNPITGSTVIPEPIELPKTIQRLTDAVKSLTLEVQSTEPILNSGTPVEKVRSTEPISNSDTPVENPNQINSHDLNTGILSVYDLLKDSLGMDDVYTAVCHAPVFKYRNERNIKASIAQDQIRQARNNPLIVQNETSPTSISGDKMFNGSKIETKKKLSNAGDENIVISVHTTDNTSDISDNSVCQDDTKDILRMVLVLGCQPGYNYVRSTLKNVRK